MKNIILFYIISLMMSFSVANAQTELRPLKVGNVTISYNQEGAANNSCILDINTTDNNGKGSGSAKSASAAILHIQKLCKCVLTPNQVLYVFMLAREEPPQWVLDNAKVVKL